MREIKFRAWEQDVKFMNDSVRVTVNPFGSKETYFQLTDSTNWIDVPKKHVMEYTGLKDKNGVEIYEGDIVRYTWDMLSDVNATEVGKKVRISKVFWSGWRASWAVGKKSCNNDLFRYVRNGNTVEVIGNIFESGEILNDSKNSE